ncbi:MAG: hypothetical protein KatS3mg103_1183 [Phycisphaerales bacterium]|nr:MAG: hypothetical protein KatS3mg103_1183 [Phycisphaerales bacterium]
MSQDHRAHAARAGRAAFWLSVMLAVAATSVLATVAALLPSTRTTALFDESGPFERASPWLWLALAGWIASVFPRRGWTVLAGMVLALAAAAREWDWHLAFTGYSVLKIPFYYRDQYPVHQKLLTGAAMLLIAASTAMLLARLVRLRPWARPVRWWAKSLAFAFGVLVFTKAVDRAPALLQEHAGLVLGDRWRAAFYAVEEGLEMLLPIFFGLYALALAQWHRATAQGQAR